MWFVRDVGIVGAIAAPVLVIAFLLTRAPRDLHPQVQQLCTLLAVAGVAAAAILVSFSGRIDRDVAAMRIGSGLIVYGAVVLPLSVVGLGRTLGATGVLVEVLCSAAVAVLLVIGLTRRGEPAMAWPAAAVAIAVCLCAAACVALTPATLPAPAVLAVAGSVVRFGWAVVAAALVVAGVRRGSVLLRRVGLGMGLIVLSHAGQLAGAPAPGSLVTGSLVTGGLRACAVAVVLAGVVPHMMTALRRQRARDVATAVRLRAAEQAGEAAERAAADHRHEMRNLVSGLSGAAYLLTEDAASAPAACPDRTELARALRTELARLGRMLDNEPPADPVPPGTGFALAPVAGTVAAVRRATGTRIDVDVAADLRAHGAAQAFAQVLTNLLVNCARHAPGANVTVRARRHGDRILVQVADDGPGVARGTERLLLRRGRRSPLTGGSGLGLDISAALMAEHGGTLRVLPAGPGTGFVVQLELPAVSPLPVPATRRSTCSPREVVLPGCVTLPATAS